MKDRIGQALDFGDRVLYLEDMKVGRIGHEQTFGEQFVEVIISPHLSIHTLPERLVKIWEQ